jgi:hypothetical protein
MTAYKVKLASVRIGDVQLYNVDGLVGQQPMRCDAARQQLPDALPDDARERHADADEALLEPAIRLRPARQSERDQRDKPIPTSASNTSLCNCRRAGTSIAAVASGAADRESRAIAVIAPR